uniref:Uncharacterized protein n=1 Tax=Romanomermis culicivorax TaxID=13658 RepID=A0A915L7N6_ROMCU
MYELLVERLSASGTISPATDHFLPVHSVATPALNADVSKRSFCAGDVMSKSKSALYSSLGDVRTKLWVEYLPDAAFQSAELCVCQSTFEPILHERPTACLSSIAIVTDLSKPDLSPSLTALASKLTINLRLAGLLVNMTPALYNSLLALGALILKTMSVSTPLDAFLTDESRPISLGSLKIWSSVGYGNTIPLTRAFLHKILEASFCLIPFFNAVVPSITDLTFCPESTQCCTLAVSLCGFLSTFTSYPPFIEGYLEQENLEPAAKQTNSCLSFGRLSLATTLSRLDNLSANSNAVEV